MASPSLAGRALLAVVLMIGFYGLAIAVAAGLLYVPYAEVAYAHKIHPKLALICIVSAGVIVWSILPRIDRFTPPGPRLLPDRHPALFHELREVASAVGQTMPAEVYLVPDVNAWVSQRGGVMGLGGRRVMGLGLPLLQVLTVSELRAVLAHEYGHFHGGDTRLGPWVYKTRSAIIRTVQSLGNGLIQKPFLLYGKMFLRLTNAVSRRQEFAADELACRAVGGRPLASGLRAVHKAALAFDPYWGNEVVPALNAGFRPAVAQGYGRFLLAKPVAEAVDRSLDEEIKTGASNPYDTHPPLRQRIAAIAGFPPGPDPSEDPPAITLLQDVAGLETELLSTLFGREPIGKLTPVAWDEVGTRVYAPMWEGLARQHAGDLQGITPGALPALANDLSEFGTRLGKTAGRPLVGDEAAKYASGVLEASLATAFLRHGWSVDAPPGAAVVLKAGAAAQDPEARIEPFNLFDRFKSGSLSADEWRQRCESLAISALDLGDVPDPQAVETK